MPRDPIVDEVRRFRSELAAKFHNDIHAMGVHAREREAELEREGRQFVSFEKKRKTG